MPIAHLSPLRSVARRDELEGEDDREGGAHSHFALDLDRATHHVDEVLHDGHAKAASLNAADRLRAFAFERVVDLLEEFGAMPMPVSETITR